VSKEFFEALLETFAREAEAGLSRIILLGLDNAGWHGPANLKIPGGIRLIYLPPSTPELQPAKLLGRLPTSRSSTSTSQPSQNSKQKSPPSVSPRRAARTNPRPDRIPLAAKSNRSELINRKWYETFRQALAATQRITGEFYKSGALQTLAPLMAAFGHGEEVRKVVHSIRDEEDRAGALISLVPHLSEPQRESVLREAMSMMSGRPWRPWSGSFYTGKWIAILPYLSDAAAAQVVRGLLEEMISLPGRFSLFAWRALAPYLSEHQIRVLVTQDSDHPSLFFGREVMLVGVIPRLAELGDVDEALEWAQQIRRPEARAETMARVAPFCTETQRNKVLNQVLQAIQGIENPEARVAAIGEHAPLLDKLCNLGEALQLARTIKDAEARFRSLKALLDHLDEPERGQILQEALDTARGYSQCRSEPGGIGSSHVLSRRARARTDPAGGA
jgi:hypothetical protein